MSLYAQKEWSNWYYNRGTLLTFKNGYAQIVQNYLPVPPASDFYNFYNWGQGGISYSDSITGDMKFIISNRLGFSNDYDDFPADPFLRSCPDKFSYHILPFHDNSKRYYVIQFQDAIADLLAQETGLQVRCPNAVGLGYSIADLNLNNGLGDFSITNQVIETGLSAQMTTVRHANGKDAWIIVHPYGSGDFHAILATDAGIQTPVISTIGPLINAGSASAGGVLTASHDGKLLAGFSSMANGMQLFDFDNATGKITNYRTMPAVAGGIMVQFSPDDSKLYYTNWASIYQYDFNQSNVGASLTLIRQDIGGLMYDMQLAPDGKIYVTKTYDFINGQYNEYTGAIECPNLPQYACNFNPKALNTVEVAFPDLINDFIHDPKAPPVSKFSLGNDTAICFGNYTITAPAGWQSYKWNTGETTQQITVDKAGVYYVLTGNTGFSCPSGYGYITIGDKAIKLDLGNDTTLCKGSSYPLHVDDDYTNITWENGSHTRDSLITTDNAYIISANDKNGCFTKDTIGIYFKYYPIADFGPDTTLCNSQTLALTMYPQSNPFFSGVYKWQDGSTVDTYTVSVPGTYWGTVSYDGCTVSDTIKVSYVTANNVSLGNDTAICAGDSLLLQSNISNATYLWSTGETTSAIYVKTGGLYWIKAGTAVCTLLDSINITVNSKPSFTLGADTVICENENLVLSPGGGYDSYFWQDNSIADNLTVQSAGLYWLRLTQNGCSASDSINVGYKLLPPVHLGNDTGICSGETLLLDAYSPLTALYTWQDQSSSVMYAVNNPGSYSVKVTGVNGCVNIDTINVSVTTPPHFSLGNDTVLCEMDVLTYNFNLPNVSWLWSDGSTQNNYTIYKPGMYSLAVTQAGCSVADTVQVAYKPLPRVNIGNDTTLCAGNSLVLSALNAGAAYKWQDNSTQSFYTVTKTGVYSVVATLNGCKAGDTTLINYKAPPSFSLGNDTMICTGQFLVLHAPVQGALSYLWQDGSTKPTYTVTQPGFYTLRISNECGTAVDDINITTFTCDLTMPNAFTPNNDGLNDIFRVKYPFPVKEFHMSIYNQWGQKVFESADITYGWDGVYKGSLSSQGVYVWTISLTDNQGRMQSAKGVVTLLR